MESASTDRSLPNKKTEVIICDDEKGTSGSVLAFIAILGHKCDQEII
jgi:hypothetical protein